MGKTQWFLKVVRPCQLPTEREGRLVESCVVSHSCANLCNMAWDKKIDKFSLGLLAGFYSFLIVYYKPWQEKWDAPDFVMMLIAVAMLLGLITCSIFLLRGKNSWRVPFIVLNIVYFLFGCYITHFAWTFWLFKEPTLMERITHTWAYFVLGVCLPVINIVKSRR